ncbi:hypothetical protein BDZ89DRAFT_119411 [Hymenopellis radicata]|nr:hypothetical protein BDZ89DRAFT_119411 [Hymenopellis radicata]
MRMSSSDWNFAGLNAGNLIDDTSPIIGVFGRRIDACSAVSRRSKSRHGASHFGVCVLEAPSRLHCSESQWLLESTRTMPQEFLADFEVSRASRSMTIFSARVALQFVFWTDSGVPYAVNMAALLLADSSTCAKFARTRFGMTGRSCAGALAVRRLSVCLSIYSSDGIPELSVS